MIVVTGPVTVPERQRESVGGPADGGFFVPPEVFGDLERHLAEQRNPVRLEDARGFWRVATMADIDWLSHDTLRLRGTCWASLRFVFTGRRDAEGRRRFRSAQPAIGPSNRSRAAVYLPAGWHRR